MEFLSSRTRLADRRGAERIAAELGASPLALAQAAAYIRAHGIDYDTYLDRLRHATVDTLLHRPPGDGYPHPAVDAVTLSLSEFDGTDPLAVATRQSLGLLSHLPPSSTRARLVRAYAALTELQGTHGDAVSEAALDRALADAAAACLVTIQRDRVEMHRFIRRVIRDQLRTRGDDDPYRWAAEYVDPRRVHRRTVTLAFATQILSGFGVGMSLVAGTLLASTLGGVPAAGLSAAASILGSAAIGFMIARIVPTRGRRPALTLAYALGALGALVCIAAATFGTIGLLLPGMFMFGAGTQPTSRPDTSPWTWPSRIDAVGRCRSSYGPSPSARSPDRC